MSKNKILLTFDLEFWYNSDFITGLEKQADSNYPNYVHEQVRSLLAVLEKKKAKATFFVLGELAVKYSGLIKEIQGLGHEIACHGFSHKRLDRQNESEFRDDIKKCTGILSDITGEKPLGYRAPIFSLDPENNWAIKALKDNGFWYDSSIFPFPSKLYGSSNSALDICRVDENKNFFEVPVAVFKAGPLRFPVAGGFYFRIMPLFIFNFLAKKILNSRPLVLYWHPHELYDYIPDIKAPYWKKKLKYWGVRTGMKKFEDFMDSMNGEFLTIKEYIKNYVKI